MKETGLLNSQDIDRVAEDGLDEDKGSIPIRLVNQAKNKEQKYIEKRKQSDQDQMGRHEHGNARETKRSGSVGYTGVHMDGRPRL